MSSYAYSVEMFYDKKKTQKMPDQACANGLKLHNIPQELESITPLEHRLVAKHIPFLTILLMKRYGGHYKVNGPCVNVTTHLDQVLEILPRMPNELQLHPLKLKHKLEYKSHYMYNMIQKDTIVESITWLKQHNPHYADIILNDDWYSSITNSALCYTCTQTCTTSMNKSIHSCKHKHTHS